MLDGGTGSDILSLAGSLRTAVLDLGLGTLTRGLENDRVISIERFELGAAGDLVLGRQDNVVLETMGGDDTVRGLSPNAQLIGGDGFDLLDLSVEVAAVTVDLTKGPRRKG